MYFRASAYKNEKPLSPEEVQVVLQLRRPGEEPKVLSFQPHGDHLRSTRSVPEPHVFAIQAVVRHQGKIYRWKYWQVEGGIELESGAIEATGIGIKTAGPAVIKTTLAFPGEIQLNPRQVAHVVPRVDGVAVEVYKFLGDKVKKGEVLAVLESRELANLRSQYLVAFRSWELAREIFEREKRLWKEKVSAEQSYLIAKKELAEAKVLLEAAAQKLYALGLSEADLQAMTLEIADPFNRYKLRAPSSGEVVEQHLTLGEAVSADAEIFTIADLSTVWGKITVYAKDLDAVQEGQEVMVQAVNMDLATGGGTVFYLGPLVGEQTRSATAYVEIPNPKGRWRPGLFITVETVQEKIRVPVAVTVEAIQTYQEHPVVFVQHGNLFEPRPVVLGLRGNVWVEVREGLSAGERYVARNSYVLKSELGKSAAAHHH